MAFILIPTSSSWLSRLLLLLSCAALARPPLPSREANPRHSAQQKETTAPEIKVSVEMVRVEVSIADKHGNLLGNLEQKNFRILDEGAERPILFFEPVDSPAWLLILVETSPAVYLIHRQHLEAAYSLLDGLAPTDQVALVTYDQAPRLLLPFTDDKAVLARALVSLQYTLGMGDLNFYDAVGASLDSLSSLPGKKALVALSTGLDSSAPSHWDALVGKLRASEVTIFPVALGGSLRNFEDQKSKKAARSKRQKTPPPDLSGNSPAENVVSEPASAGMGFEKANEVFQSMAQITGGRVFFPASANDFASIYHEIAATLRHQYLLGFEPAARDGRVHTIEVQLLDTTAQPTKTQIARGELRIYARQAYLAPGP